MKTIFMMASLIIFCFLFRNDGKKEYNPLQEMGWKPYDPYWRQVWERRHFIVFFVIMYIFIYIKFWG